jgi:hypothetical protein
LRLIESGLQRLTLRVEQTELANATRGILRTRNIEVRLSVPGGVVAGM